MLKKNRMQTWIFLISWIHIFGFGATEQTLTAQKFVENSLLLFYTAPKESRLTFNQAKEYCSDHDSVIVKVSNVYINNAIRDFYDQVKWKANIWLGLTDIENEGRWKWVADGGGISYYNWRPGEPNDGGWDGRGEDCVYMQNGGVWNDNLCSLELNFVCQKEFKNVYHWGIHTFTFHVEEKKSFAGALRSCAEKNSRLVEIPTEAINNYLKPKVQKYIGSRFAWTGGSDLQTKNTWLWNNRSHIDTTRTRWGWKGTGKHREPNGHEEHCLGVSNTGWADLKCNNELAYICEQVQVSEVRPKPSDFTVQVSGNNVIWCDLRGIYPQPSVSWYFEGKEVAESSTNSIYQTKGQAYATLNTESATITEEGSYICRTNNTIGNTPFSAKGSAMFKVPSQPNIILVKSNSCNSSLVITWKPNKRAIGIKHRINVSNDVGIAGITQMITPHTDNPQTFVTRKLKSSTSYKVQITPCPNACKYSASKESITGGKLPGNVRNASIVRVGRNDCKVTWKPPTVAPSDAISSYKINILERIAALATSSSENGILEETKTAGPNTTFLFNGKPNRKFSFSVQAVTCAGAGAMTNLTEIFITEKQAPSEVPKPTVSGGIDEEGKATLSFQIPDQTNGPLSCLFVMVRPNENPRGEPAASLTELQRANASSLENEYIAVALATTRLTGTSKNINLGDGIATSCNIHAISPRQRRSTNKDEVFVGRNMKLDPNIIYSVYTVSATPAGQKVLMKASDIQTLVAITTKELEGGTSTIMIASILGGLVLIAIIIGIVIFVKRRKQNADTRDQQQSNEHVYEYPTIPIGLHEQPGYEFVEENHAQRKIGVPEDSAYETYDARQPHPGSEKRAEAATPPGGEGEYEVSMRQYEEIK